MPTVLSSTVHAYMSSVLGLLRLLYWDYCIGSTMSPAGGLQRLLY